MTARTIKHEGPSSPALLASGFEALCDRVGGGLTRQRRAVLDLVASSTAPVSAYEIMRRMNIAGASVKPPTVYRALEFLEAQGVVHRIDSLKAYVACAGVHQASQTAAFLICDGCGLTLEIEVPAAEQALRQSAEDRDFEIAHAVQEVRGLCAICRPIQP